MCPENIKKLNMFLSKLHENIENPTKHMNAKTDRYTKKLTVQQNAVCWELNGMVPLTTVI